MKTTVGVIIADSHLRFKILNELRRLENSKIVLDRNIEAGSITTNRNFYKTVLITDEVNLTSENISMVFKEMRHRMVSIILVVSRIEMPKIKDYFEMGIKGFVSKAHVHNQLIEAILTVSQEKLFTKGLLN